MSANAKPRRWIENLRIKLRSGEWPEEPEPGEDFDWWLENQAAAAEIELKAKKVEEPN